MMRPSFLSRERVGSRLAQAGVLPLLRPLHDRMRTPVLVLAYHRVLPEPDPESYPFDLGLISATPEEFDWQMKLVSREFDPISLSDVGSYVRGRFKLPRRPVVVTFDDGYADNHDHALPILQRYGMPATVFTAVGHIGTDNLMWHDWAAYLCLRARSGEIPSLNGPQMLSESDPIASRRKVAHRFLSYLKTRPHTELLSTLADLRRQHAGAILPDELALSRPLTWDQVRHMAASGVEFGSHTTTHAILSRLDDQGLRAELVQSKAVLERELQMPCDSIAYPVGRTFAYTPKILAEVGLTGYRLGLAYNPGINWGHALDVFALQRQAVESHINRHYFRAMLSLPSWFQ